MSSEVSPEPEGKGALRPRGFAAVAVKIPVLKVFDYKIPDTLIGTLDEGARVRVPFGKRSLSGTVVELLEEARHHPVKEIQELLGEKPLLPPSLLSLCRWMSEYYVCGLGEVLESVVPAPLRGQKGRSYLLKVRLLIEKRAGKPLIDELLEKQPKQARVLRLLLEAGESIGLNELMSRAKVSRSPIETLARKEIVALEREDVVRDPLDEIESDSPRDIDPTQEQQDAIDRVVEAIEAERYEGFLLFGVTGSGKTEVYLRTIREVVARGRQAIVLVPEIALTPQTLRRFRARFDRLAVLHSRLTDAQRADQWKRIREGAADVIVGARSALFAPVPKLGLVVVDEEHESTFKQQQAPRYHARDVALMRGFSEKAPVILGSATPSLETWQRTREGRLTRLDLRTRVGGGALPRSIVVDLAQSLGSSWKSVISDRLRVSIEEALSRREQIILFLNRRGYAPSSYCGVCRESLPCPDCSVSLTYHDRSKRLVCHYCGHERLPPTTCPTCGRGKLRLLGFGTERVEAEVRRTFRSAKIARMDSDTMMARGSHERVLGEFARGKLDILIGTQMIAKGLDFPNVTLVGVLMADAALSLPDFRASERTFQLVAQVAGRAGRSHKEGTVVVQSFNPRHPSIQLAIAHDFESFVGGELHERSAMGYPPYGYLARFVVSAEEVEAVEKGCQALRDSLEAAVGDSPAMLLGPSPAPLERIAGRIRHHAILKADERKVLRQCLDAFVRNPPKVGKARLTVDVDPVQTL